MSVDVNGLVVHGHFDERFANTVEVFASHFESGEDLGASFALSKDGEVVLDIWAGFLDQAKTEPWQEDSIVNVYSSTKTVSFLCSLVLADRGELDFDAPVSRYWPEFAQNGKDNVLVWHLMDHAAGLSGMDVPVQGSDLYDWEKITTLLAEQKPWWEPGTASAYHALTQGYLIGEVTRRITGQTMGEFLQAEIAGPLGADFFIGVPDEALARVGDLVVPPETSGNIQMNDDPDSIGARTFANPAAKAEESLTRAWRQAEIPAANGHGNARSLVRLQTPLANGGSAFGVNLVSEATAASIMRPRISGTDMALGMPVTFGLGFALNDGPIPLSPNPNSCYWAGWGGSTIMVDQDAHVVVSFAMNKMFPSLIGDTRSYENTQAAYQDLG